MRKDWKETTLGEVAEVKGGKRLPKGTPWSEVRTSQRYIRATDIKSGCINEEALVFVPDSVANIISNYKVVESDVLITIAGTIGDSALVQRSLDGCNLTENAARIRIESTQIMPRFVAFWLESDLGVAQISASTIGTTQKKLPLYRINAFSISLPPLAEQRRIVDVIESVDTYITALQTRAETARNALSALVDASTSFSSNTPMRPLRDVTTKIGSGATPRGGEAAYQISGTSLIRSQNVHDYRFVVEGLARINEAQARLLDNAEVAFGDVLINITGASVNRVCLAPSRYLPARVNQHVAILRPNPEVLFSDFLMYALRRNDIKAELDALASSGTTRQALTKGQLEDFVVPVPPLAEQRRIVDIIESVDSTVTTAEDAVANARNLRSALLSDLLSGDHEIPKSYDKFLGAA